MGAVMTFRTNWEKSTLNARVFFYLKRLLREATLNSEQVKQLQLKRLKHLLNHANDNFEFYRDRFKKCGLDPRNFSSVKQLETIPILTKSDYREFVTSLRESKPSYYRGWHEDATSGSTGAPMKIWRTWDERAYTIAKWLRSLHLNGYKWNDVTFSLPSPYRLAKDSVIQRLGIMKRYMVPNTAPSELMVSEYLRVQPDVLYGNKSQLVQMALYAQRQSIELPYPRFYVSAAETLDETSREIIVRTFGPNIAEVYGAIEFNNLAWRTAGEDFFHFSHTTDLLELTKDGMPSEQDGNCVITDLFIHSFPLIRYQLGDYLETETVDGLRVIKKILGRSNDWIVFRDGTCKSFHPFWKIIRRRPEILQFRVIQESLGLLRIILVKDRSASATNLEDAIVKDLRTEIRDGDIEYKIEWVDEIAPDPNGKLRVLISKVQQQQIPAPLCH